MRTSLSIAGVALAGTVAACLALAALLRFLVLVRLCHRDFVQGPRLRSRTCLSLLAQLQRRTGAC